MRSEHHTCRQQELLLSLALLNQAFAKQSVSFLSLTQKIMHRLCQHVEVNFKLR
jgi:hypothetical protein